VNATAKRALSSGMKNLLLLVAIVVAFLAIVSSLSLIRDRGCDRLEAEMLSYLEPGHDSPGPDYVYVRGVGTDRSQLREYLDAQGALIGADCDEPG
jgi:hypothetical protein